MKKTIITIAACLSLSTVGVSFAGPVISYLNVSNNTSHEIQGREIHGVTVGKITDIAHGDQGVQVVMEKEMSKKDHSTDYFIQEQLNDIGSGNLLCVINEHVYVSHAGWAVGDPIEKVGKFTVSFTGNNGGCKITKKDIDDSSNISDRTHVEISV